MAAFFLALEEIKLMAVKRQSLATSSAAITKARCIESQVDNNLLPKKDRLFGSNVIGYKLKENTGDESCPYYTMKEVNFLDHVRKLQTEKAREILVAKYPDAFKFNLSADNHQNFPPVQGSLDEIDVNTLKKHFKYKKSHDM